MTAEEQVFTAFDIQHETVFHKQLDDYLSPEIKQRMEEAASKPFWWEVDPEKIKQYWYQQFKNRNKHQIKICEWCGNHFKQYRTLQSICTDCHRSPHYERDRVRAKKRKRLREEWEREHATRKL